MTWRLIELPCVSDARGQLVFAEAEDHVPFAIRRIYSIFGVPEGRARGAHAHRRLQQCFIAMSGSFKVQLSDGKNRETVTLDRPSQTLYLGSMMWRDVTDFSIGACCLVLASEHFDADDYMHDYQEFQALAGMT